MKYPSQSPITSRMLWSVLSAMLLLSACAPPAPICAPNVTRGCMCVGGGTGVQTCMASGNGYTVCDCGSTVRDSGVPPIDVPSARPDVPNYDAPNAPVDVPNVDVPNVDVPNVDIPNPPMCRMGPENTVAACSDGCSNDGDNFVDCNDFDCCNLVACGPNTSCGRRAMCAPCDLNLPMCPAGTTCALRSCDARPGCYPNDPNAQCTTINNIPCPAVAAYDRCVDDASCGPSAVCVTMNFTRVPWGVRRCSPDLGAGGAALNCGRMHCPEPPRAFMGITAVCDFVSIDLRSNHFGCRLTCAAGAMCPYGLRCVNGNCID